MDWCVPQILFPVHAMSFVFVVDNLVLDVCKSNYILV